MRHIVLARIDDRLIHGQVVTAWCKTTGANKIVIADDKLPEDSFTQRLLKAAAPPGLEVVILTVAQAAGYLQEEGSREERIILLAKTPQAMEALAAAGAGFKKMNLGGMGAKSGRSKLNKNISASEEEVASLRRMSGSGIEIYYQLVPAERAVDAKSFLV